MRDSDLAHLLTISELRHGLVARIMFFSARAVFAAHERTALYSPIKEISALAAFGTFRYLLLTDGTVPTRRPPPRQRLNTAVSNR